MLIVVPCSSVSGAVSGGNDGATGLPEGVQRGPLKVRSLCLSHVIELWLGCQFRAGAGGPEGAGLIENQGTVSFVGVCVETTKQTEKASSQNGPKMHRKRFPQRKKIANTNTRAQWQGRFPGTAHPLVDLQAASECSVSLLKLGSSSVRLPGSPDEIFRSTCSGVRSSLDVIAARSELAGRCVQNVYPRNGLDSRDRRVRVSFYADVKRRSSTDEPKNTPPGGF
jgi:hypothetical protein